jgi:N-acetylglucosaminyldiphosphoundecaprenol N-acetyl-beta-D-mannosaminyltransferase
MLGVRIGSRSLEELVAASEAAIRKRCEPFVFACANPHSLVVARADTEFQDALERASAVVADGVGCTWVAKLAGISVGPRITGSDFFVSVMGMLDRAGGRAFFFGSRDEVLRRMIERAAHQFPRVEVASLSPPFRPWSAHENDEMIGTINDFKADVLWVGMTAPKQEKWVASNMSRLRVPVVGSVGAVFDYYAGVTKRAPQWICSMGLEWLYRLPREPKRLWRRTLVSAPKFLLLVMRERITGRAHSPQGLP